MKKYAFALALLLSANSAFAYVPGVQQKLDVLLSIVKSPKADADTKKDIDNLIGPSKKIEVRLHQFECENTKSTQYDYNFTCDISLTTVERI